MKNNQPTKTTSLQKTQKLEKVWDKFIRFFHWSLLLLIILAFLTSEFSSVIYNLNILSKDAPRDALWWHTIIGYMVLTLILLRFTWGWIGGKYARFSSFPLYPLGLFNYFKGVFTWKPTTAYRGHHPASAVITILFLLVLFLESITGIIAISTIHFKGVFVEALLTIDDDTSQLLNTLHDILSKVLLGLITIHLLGVLIACIQYKKNIVLTMITGKK